MTEPAPARSPVPAAASGWAEKLREPIRHVERPAVEQAPPVDAPEPVLTWSYPAIVDQLLSGSAGNAVRHLAEQLKHLGIARDLRSIAFCGPGRTAGRTSLTLALTKVLTLELATRVTLVDADFAHSDLARAVGLQPATGLWTPTTDQSPAAAVVKPLVPGWLSLVPVAQSPSAQSPTGESLNGRLIGAIHAFWRTLKQNCDLLLIDAGPWDSPSTPLLIDSRAIDACVGVCRFQTPQGAWPGNEQLRQPGIEWLGIVETFVPPSQLPSQRT
jgi:Mrp family chromosome partitioning ATPase